MYAGSRSSAGYAAAFAFLAIVSAGLACSDRSPTTTSDEWTQATLVGLQVRQTAVLFDSSGVVHRDTRLITTPKALGLQQPELLPPDRKAGITVRHFRDATGSLHSIGLYRDRDGWPIRETYLFQNGRIRAIVSARHEQRGGGFVRRALRITTFDQNGRPDRQLDLKPSGNHLGVREQQGRPLMALLADAAAVVLPKTLHAEEVPSACLSEWLESTSATLALAVANTALTAAVGGCVPSKGTLCPTIELAFTAWVAALAKWNTALDKLVLCIEKNRKPTGDDAAVTGGSESEGGSGATNPVGTSPSGDGIEEFIQNAIASGNFWCSASGDYCVYLAAT